MLRRFLLIFVPTVLLLTLSRCGRDENKEDSGEGGAGSGNVPNDWDGLADYAASQFTVVDE